MAPLTPTPGPGESYGSTGYPENTTDVDTYCAGGNQFGRSGSGRGGEYGPGTRAGEQQTGQGGGKPSVGQKIKGQQTRWGEMMHMLNTDISDTFKKL